jgi:segregation and condensation protein B
MNEDETVSNEIAENEIVDDPLEDITEAVSAVVTGHLSDEDVKNIIEATIFASNKPVSIEKICTLFADSVSDIREKIKSAIEILINEYQTRGVELIEVSSGFRFQVVRKAAPWVSRLWEEKPQKYSRALLETLALIAYRQPVTRGEIEEIRGVSVSSNIMRTLVDREWVRVVGHRDVPGKPGIYATTRQFLDYFSLKRLDELPSLAEIRDFDKINKELDFSEYDSVKDNSNSNDNSSGEL